MPKASDLTKYLETKTEFRALAESIRNKMTDMGFSPVDIQTKLDKLQELHPIRIGDNVHMYHASVHTTLLNFLHTLYNTDPKLNPNASFRLRRGAGKEELDK